MRVLKRRKDGVVQAYNKKSWYVTKKKPDDTLVFALKRNPTVRQIENAYLQLPGVYYLGYTRDELERVLKSHNHLNLKFVEV